MKQHPAIPVMIQAFQFSPVAAAEQESGFAIGIQLVGVTYKRHQRLMLELAGGTTVYLACGLSLEYFYPHLL